MEILKKRLYIYFLIGLAGAAFSFSAYLFVYTPRILDTTSSASKTSSSTSTPQFSILFIGDMMFDREVRNTVNKHGYSYVFGDSPELFAGSDLVIGNLEGPITSNPSKTLLPDGSQIPNLLTFTFPPETAMALKQSGVGMVTLANNHEENFGKAGINETKRYLDEAGVSYFGDPENKEEIATTTCRGSICVGLIGYSQFSNPDDSEIIQQIHDLKKKVDFVVVFAHWGEEYNSGIIQSQRMLAHRWIDEGADLIIGAHPHVVEPIETYKGKTIFYSLGNYIFDQYFSFNTTHSIAARIHFSKSSYGYDIVPVQNTGVRISIPDATTSSEILDSIKKIQ